MKRSILTATILLAGFFSMNADAQSKSQNTGQSKMKIDKQIGQVDSTIAVAKNTAAKSKEVVKDLVTIFGAKAPNEGAIVIPAIEYDDTHLVSLVAAIKDRKEVKKASLEYADGVATIKMVLKAKAQLDFWNDLPQEVREVFKTKSKQANNLLLEYKPANSQINQLAQN